MIPLHNSSQNRGSFLSFPIFFFLRFLVDVRGLSMLVSYHITHSYPHGVGRSSHTAQKKKRSPTHKIGEWRIIILLFHYMGGFFFFFLLACLLIGWFICLSLYGVDICTYISILLVPFSLLFHCIVYGLMGFGIVTVSYRIVSSSLSSCLWKCK